MSQEGGRLRNTISIVADCSSILSATVITVLGATFLITLTSRIAERAAGPPSDRQGPRPSAAVSPITDLTIPLFPRERDGLSKVVMMEFTDFQCPFCARYAKSIYPRLRAEFFDPELVSHIVRSLPLESIHPAAFKASEAAECAREQGRYWDMYDRLFASPDQLAADALNSHARALGLDRDAFHSCIIKGRAEVVRADIEQARRIGVRSTPTFFIGVLDPDRSFRPKTRILGLQAYETYQAALRSAIEEARPAGIP